MKIKAINFFQFALVLAFVALASCAPQYNPQVNSAKDDSKNAVILRYDSDNIGVDGYNYM